MTSARTGQAVSGVAQGAAMGYSMGGPYGAIAGGIIGGIGGLISGGSADAQFANQQAWAQYNRTMRLNTARYNIKAGLSIASLNAASVKMAAYAQTQATDANVIYNSSMITATTNYNASLLNDQLSQVWEDEELDLETLESFRARERGIIIADQAASGTVIGEGSNAEVVISQQTQEAIDANIIMFNADRVAASIRNERAQTRWQGAVAISQVAWEGEIQNYITNQNANIQAGSILAGAAIQATAQNYNANQAFFTEGVNIQQNEAQFSMQNHQNMISGLFSAGSSATASYFGGKTPGQGAKATTSSGSGFARSPIATNQYGSRSLNVGGTQSYALPSTSINTAGSSLVSGQ